MRLHPVEVCWWISDLRNLELLWQWRCPTCCDDFWLNKNQGTHNWKGEVHLHFKGPCWFEQRKKVSYARLNFLIKMDLFWWKTWTAQLETWNLVVVHSKPSLPHRVRFAVWSLEVESWHWSIPTMGDDHSPNTRDIYIYIHRYFLLSSASY